MKVSTPKMIEMLMEKPERKAKKGIGTVMYLPARGGLFFVDKKEGTLAEVAFVGSILHATWEIIEPEAGPVYFMEAFRAWQTQDKEIICKDKEGRTLDKLYPAAKNDTIKARHILEGKWYIRDYTGRDK